MQFKYLLCALQLDVTKTSDNKSTFLHVLAGTVSARFPEVLTLGEELHAIPEAAKGRSQYLRLLKVGRNT